MCSVVNRELILSDESSRSYIEPTASSNRLVQTFPQAVCLDVGISNDTTPACNGKVTLLIQKIEGLRQARRPPADTSAAVLRAQAETRL